MIPAPVSPDLVTFSMRISLLASVHEVQDYVVPRILAGTAAMTGVRPTAVLLRYLQVECVID